MTTPKRNSLIVFVRNVPANSIQNCMKRTREDPLVWEHQELKTAECFAPTASCQLVIRGGCKN